MKTVSLSDLDFGVVLEVTLVFDDYDPAGAEVVLFVYNTGAPDDPPRSMTLAGTVAKYTVVDGDFSLGLHLAEITVEKSGVRLTSEQFTIRVT
jgi:hypothetical protein